MAQSHSPEPFCLFLVTWLPPARGKHAEEAPQKKLAKNSTEQTEARK
jgi:hypothetical protein